MADKEMSLSKISGKRAISKSPGVVDVSRAIKAETGGDHFYGVTANIPYNTKLRNSAVKVKALTEANLIVLTVNPQLDNASSSEKLNSKAASAKQMFANYRSKK